MQNIYFWRIIPSGLPTVLKNCPRCKCNCEYESTGNFRVNANQNHIDVWLIYQCRKCKYTWNMEILSRVNQSTIGKELYQKFLANDKGLALQYAYDVAVHARNKSVLCYDDITYEITGDAFPSGSPKEPAQVKLVCEYDLDIRLDKLLSRQLGIPREQVKRLCGLGKITGESIKDPGKARARNGMLLTFNL
jgi:hypothetical protein